MRTAFALLAAFIFEFLAILSIRLAGERRKLGIIREAVDRRFRVSSWIAGAMVLPYLAIEGWPGPDAEGRLAGAITRMVAWLPFFLLAVAQASFLRKNAAVPLLWLATGGLLLWLTVPSALAWLRPIG